MHGPAEYRRAQANLEIGNVTEVARDSAGGGDEDSDHDVGAFVGTFTEGSVKISPSFKGNCMRFALHCWDKSIVVFVLAAVFQ